MNVIAVIMGGGAGTRLQPLTRDRAKPAVPIAGKYRLVDIPISNCINSHIRRMFLLTQFNSVSLHQHVAHSFQFDQFHRGYVRLLAAQQTPSSVGWFEGTADAVRKSFRYFLDEQPDLIIILSGDQLYRMDFNEVIAQHVETRADVTIATKPVPRSEAGALGIMQVNDQKRITRFVEKPGDSPLLDDLRSPFGGDLYLASMGIYVFNAKVLQDLLGSLPHSDFGRDIIPEAIQRHEVYGFIFNGYWRDIGTIGSFWKANLELTEPNPPFTFYDARAPVYTHMRYLPPSKINCCDLNRTLLCEGCIITGHRILHSIVGIRAVVGEGSVIEHSVVMGCDYYEGERPPPEGDVPPLGIGRDCFIRNAIIDKNARIGDGCYITPDNVPEGTSTPLYTVRDGVIVIPKKAVIPPGTRI